MSAILDAITPIMNDSIGVTAARGVFRTLPTSVNASPGALDVVEVRELLMHLETSGRIFSTPGRALPVKRLRELITAGLPAREKVERFGIRTDIDVLTVQRATQALTKSFFSVTDCVRLATAVSELARNIYMYAKSGTVTLKLSEEPTHWCFELEAVDQGPGITNLDVIFSGGYRSRTGLGRGLIGTRALLDDMQVDSAPGRGTRVSGVRRAGRR